MRLQDELPADHKLAQVYRYGAGLMGLVLIAFGILGFTDNVGFFSTSGPEVVGVMSTNGALSTISVVVGAILLVGAAVGGNVASTINIVVGALFIISGFVNLGLMAKGPNLLAFEMSNVIFSFVVGLMIMTFGLYGRVSANLPHDNPYWRARHPKEAEREAAYRDRRELLGGRGPTPTRAQRGH